MVHPLLDSGRGASPAAYETCVVVFFIYSCRRQPLCAVDRRTQSAMSCADFTAAVGLVENSTAPADAAEKKHHLRDGKTGFVNPWPSWQPMNPEAVKAHLKKSVR